MIEAESVPASATAVLCGLGKVTSQCLSFPFCKMGLIMQTSAVREVEGCKVLSDPQLEGGRGAHGIMTVPGGVSQRDIVHRLRERDERPFPLDHMNWHHKLTER